MRSTTFLVAFAATVLAGPVAHKRDHREHHKRAVVTQYSYETVTKYVTAGEQPAETEAADPAVKTVMVQAGGDNNNGGNYGSKPKPTNQAPPAPPAPQPTQEKSTYQAPAPQPSTSQEPETSEAPAPSPATSSQEPATTSDSGWSLPDLIPSSSSSSAPASSGSVSIGDYDMESYQGQVMYYHNVHRANHSADSLTWNSSLADSAKVLANRCQFQHDVDIHGGGYGQNLAASSPNANVSCQISDSWYNNEIEKFAPYFGIESPQVSMETFESYGHFTQLVWKGTKTVGCATVDCTGKPLGMWYTVCNYAPAGNIDTTYATNVEKPGLADIIHGAADDLTDAIYALTG